MAEGSNDFLLEICLLYPSSYPGDMGPLKEGTMIYGSKKDIVRLSFQRAITYGFFAY